VLLKSGRLTITSQAKVEGESFRREAEGEVDGYSIGDLEMFVQCLSVSQKSKKVSQARRDHGCSLVYPLDIGNIRLVVCLNSC